jgi:hypothetical protein
MKKIIFILTLSFLMVNCTPDKNGATPSNNSTFAMELVPTETNLVIDQPLAITVNANEPIGQLWVSFDNFATGSYAIQSFGSSYTLHFNFDDLGQKTISVRVKNSEEVVSEKKVVINVTRGNAVKVTGLQVTSFYGINTVYDPEFAASNPESLADLKFGFLKSLLRNSFENSYSFTDWYQSSVIPNQGNMTWDLTDAQLYIDPTKTIRFGLGEMDGGVGGADLMNGAPYYREISFSNYLTTKPTAITYSYPEINLEFKVFVEWPN